MSEDGSEALASPDDVRKALLEQVKETIGVQNISGISQDNTDPTDTRYTLHLDDGRAVIIGTIDVLWSKANFSKFLAVSLQRVVPGDIKPAEWTRLIGLVVQHVVEVQSVGSGQSYADDVLEWVRHYTQNASDQDANGAITALAPFIQEPDLYIHVQTFAKWVRGEYRERVEMKELWRALRTLGFERETVNNSVPQKNGAVYRTTKSYWRAPIAGISPHRLSVVQDSQPRVGGKDFLGVTRNT